MAKEGMIRIFCGGGKGKTSAALGAAYKSMKEGSVAYILQFAVDEAEAKLLKKFEPEMKVFCFEKDMALNFAKKVITARECDILILDEILSLLEQDAGDEGVILELMELQKSNRITLILTGNYITQEIAKEADYITEFTRKK